MLVFGLGLTESHWKVIFQSIQKPLSQKMTARLLSQSEIQPQSIISTCEDISKSPPALFLLTPQGFKAFTDCLFFLSQLQMRISRKQTQYGLILENIEKDLYPFVIYHPQVTLANKMSLTISDPSLLLKQPIRRFPRIRIAPQTIRLEYQSLNDTTVNQSLEEIPANQLIPLNQIHTIFTDQGAQHVEQWLSDFLQKEGRLQELPKVKGILKETQGGYLFPGIPIDRIQTMNLGDIQIQFLLAYHQLSPRSVAFKRMIHDLENYQRPSPPSASHRPQTIPLRCLGRVPIINQLVEIHLAKLGIENIRFINHLPPGIHTLEDSLLWLQLSHFEDVMLEGKLLNLQNEIQTILQPLAFFVELDPLKILPKLSSEWLSRIEMEKQRDDLMAQEKQRIHECHSAKNHQLLLNQEEEVLKDATQIAQRLMHYLAHSFAWEEVLAMKTTLTGDQVLFFCEEQEQAYELNQRMAHVSKKLWINPKDYQDADQLRQLPIELVQQYAQHGKIVVTADSMKHWEWLHHQIFERFQEISEESLLQKTTMQQNQTELEKIQQQKSELALQWLSTSIEQLLKRYQELLNPPLANP